jgi:hypothetical protein
LLLDSASRIRDEGDSNTLYDAYESAITGIDDDPSFLNRHTVLLLLVAPQIVDSLEISTVLFIDIAGLSFRQILEGSYRLSDHVKIVTSGDYVYGNESSLYAFVEQKFSARASINLEY